MFWNSQLLKHLKLSFCGQICRVQPEVSNKNKETWRPQQSETEGSEFLHLISSVCDSDWTDDSEPGLKWFYESLQLMTDKWRTEQTL